MNYIDTTNVTIEQHGFNLFWIGIVSYISAFDILKGNKSNIFLAALVGGLADLSYFIFLDLGGFVKFMPGTLMTTFSYTAIILSFYVIILNISDS